MKRMVVILYNLRSAYNVGSIFRTADALQVEKLYLVGTTPTPVDRFGRYRKDISKVSLGAERTVDWQYGENLIDVVNSLKPEFKIAALEQDENSIDYSNLSSENNIALILGNEPVGLSDTELECTDVIFEIPMFGSKESLNVAVAFAVAGYKFKEVYQ